jgi:hypothetical protein
MFSTSITSRPAQRRALTAVLAMTAATALTGTAQPASAASHRPCTIVKHTGTSGVTTIGTATATVVADGIKLTTARSANPDKVSWRTTFKPVPAGTVTEVSYETVKLDTPAADTTVVNDSALPAYHLYVKTAKGDGVLVFEPYYYLMSKGAGTPQRSVRTEWNVLDGPLWTPSTTFAGLDKTAGGPATLTFAQVAAANPGMTVTGIGFGLGTYNPGVIAVLDEQRFATTKKCTEHQWSTSFKSGNWWPWRR